MHHAFLYISLPSTARLPVKMPNFTFCEGRKQAITKFILFMNLDIQLQKSSLGFDKVSELDQMGILYQTESFLTGCSSSVHKLVRR